MANGPKVNSQILQEEQSLEGIWRFSIGDDEQWKEAHFDDSNWETIRVPGAWESRGYNDYNGFAWYRKTIRLDVVPQHDLILRIGSIDDADEVFVNGRFVGRTGGLPPHPQTEYNTQRNYTIPQSYWKSGNNTIAIRVYDLYNHGGITGGPVTLYSNLADNLLALNLSGQWKFAVHNQNNAEQINYNDEHWSSIEVPAKWEEAGWPDYDGVAWYRKSFALPEHLLHQELILLLGKIDDEDKTWFNGTRIGGVSPGNLRSSLARGIDGHYQAYSTLRAYKIPASLVKKDNTIAIRVFDSGIDGGIYEGPVGIMTQDQFERFKKMAKQEPDFIDTIWEWLNN
ncbi:beta galactosidase jelly roll domain-containing protein [Carboxylicivirga sp. M1479]|uniref:beta galactosidase jelly roll domain-containing protein n=1 Tax=Carboxylicivirga sp. M1479 TaxID=2594476 RepID=UPI00163DB1D7|nr:beta galactosidase jelly roll domain-containing protein [Carboxylicivirga sp. M1479]